MTKTAPKIRHVKIPSHLIADKSLTDDEFRLLCIIAETNESTHNFWIAGAAAIMRCSEQSLIELLSCLQEKKLIEYKINYFPECFAKASWVKP